MSRPDSTNLSESTKNSVVYMAAALAWRHPEVFWPVKLNLAAAGVDVKVVFRTGNIWTRDYMPVRTGEVLTLFKYKTTKYKSLDVSEVRYNGITESIYASPIVLDGGNVVQSFNWVIMTDKVVKDNPGISMWDLQSLFGKGLIIIPVEPGDDLGHADGIVKFIGPTEVLVNDYSGIAKRDKRFVKYQKDLENILRVNGITFHRITNAYDKWDWNMSEETFRQCFPDADDYNPGFGYYINFFKIADTILLPAMKISQDVDAFNCVRKHYPDCRIVVIDCSSLSMEGGLLNCVIWSL